MKGEIGFFSYTADEYPFYHYGTHLNHRPVLFRHQFSECKITSLQNIIIFIGAVQNPTSPPWSIELKSFSPSLSVSLTHFPISFA